MELSSAVAQEGVSRVSSYITSTLVDVASRENMVQMVEMAVSKLELAIERTGKLPITDAALLRRRQMIKTAYTEGKKLLRKHKQQQQQLLRLEDREEVGQAVPTSSFLGRVTHAANRSILFLLGFNKVHLSSSAVRKFDMFADWADKFLADVESGCTLRHHMLSNNSLVRLLFEWITLGCGTKEGTLLQRGFAIWTTRSEERGVEASLAYMYDHPAMPEKSFLLKLGLRLSESTDVIGTAIRCLQPLVTTDKLKVAAESAIGELSQRVTASNLLEVSPSREHALVPLKNYCAYMSRMSRSDPVCCHRPNEHSEDNAAVSSELSHMCPEEVIFLEFNFTVLAETRCSLRSRSSDGAGSGRRSGMYLPLELEVTFMPHFHLGGVFFLRLAAEEGSVSIEFGSDHKYRVMISVREVLDTVGSAATRRFLHRPELTHYGIHWFARHGAAIFDVRKPTARRRSAKRKR